MNEKITMFRDPRKEGSNEHRKAPDTKLMEKENQEMREILDQLHLEYEKLPANHPRRKEIIDEVKAIVDELKDNGEQIELDLGMAA